MGFQRGQFLLRRESLSNPLLLIRKLGSSLSSKISARVTLCRVLFVKCGLTERPSLLIATPMLLPKSIWKYPGAWECYPSRDRPMLVGSSNRGALLSRCCALH